MSRSMKTHKSYNTFGINTMASVGVKLSSDSEYFNFNRFFYSSSSLVRIMMILDKFAIDTEVGLFHSRQ